MSFASLFQGLSVQTRECVVVFWYEGTSRSSSGRGVRSCDLSASTEGRGPQSQSSVFVAEERAMPSVALTDHLPARDLGVRV